MQGDDPNDDVLLLYDVTATERGNRTRASGSFVDVGIPIYPTPYRETGSYHRPEANGSVGRLISPRPVWAGQTVIFGYSRGVEVDIVRMAFNGARVAHVAERAIDVSAYVRSLAVPANDIVEFEEIRVVAMDGDRVHVRIRLGPADKTIVRWLDLELP